MKTMKTICSLIAVFGGVMLLLACNNNSNQRITLSAADAEAAVRVLEKKEIEAILNKDTTTLKTIWSPKFTVNSPLLHKLVEREQVLKMTQNDIIAYEKFDRNIEHVTFLGDVLVTMGEEIIIPKSNNPDAGKTIKRRFTNVWHYQNGNWVATNRHAHIVR